MIMSQVALKEQTETPTHQQSLTLMRNLLRASLSCICYLRNIFDESCFMDKNLSGISIKTLLPNTPESSQLCEWMEKGVFDAMQKKYLRKIIFGIYLDPERETSLLESYNFTITYPNDEISMSFDTLSIGNPLVRTPYPSKEDIKDATTTLIRRLMCMTSTLNKLPKNRYITMRLLYYPHTPTDYEPRFFTNADNDGGVEFVADPVQMTIGDVKTPFHAVKLKVITATDQLDQNEETELPEVTTVPAAEVLVVDATRQKTIERAQSSDDETQAYARAETDDSDDFTQDEFSHDDRVQIVLQAVAKKEVEANEEAIRAKFFNYPSKVLEDAIKQLPKPNKRQLAASSEVKSSSDSSSKASQVPASAPATPQTPRVRVVGAKEVNIKLELAKLYKRALEATIKETSVSSKKLQRDLLVNSKMADELIQKLLKDKCIKDSGAKNRGKDVDKEKTQRVLEVVDNAIKEFKNSDSAPNTPKDLKRKREEESQGSKKFFKAANSTRCSVAKSSPFAYED